MRVALLIPAAIVSITTLVVGCSGIQQAFAPLAPATTLALQAFLMPGDRVAGEVSIRLTWTPPDESVDFVVLEVSRQTSEGPWEEFAAINPARGFHQELDVYRPGRTYYFRVFLVRGNEETAPTEPVEVWVPYEPRPPTPTPWPTSTPTPTPDPTGFTDRAVVPAEVIDQPRSGLQPTPSPTATPTPAPE